MEKKKLFEKLKRRFKALVLAGTLAGTATACGPSYYVGEEGLSSSVVTELETEGKTESKTEGKTESKTEGKTEGKTESKTESKTENKQDPTNANASVKTNNGGSTNNNTSGKTNTGSSNNNTSGKTNTGSSNNNTSGKTNNGGSTNNNQGGSQQQSEQPKQQEQTQPQQPQTQPEQPQTQPEQPQTQIISREYNKYDLLDQDPSIAAAAFEKLSTQLYEELYQGYGVSREYGYSNGYGECRVALAVLNYNMISPEVLASDEALGGYDYQTILNLSHSLDFGEIEYLANSRVDFSKYMIDESFANYINNTNDAWIDYQNGNEENYLNITNAYFDNGDESDYIKDYFLKFSLATCFDIGIYHMDNMLYSQDIYDENIINPMYQNYESYKGRSYSR